MVGRWAERGKPWEKRRTDEKLKAEVYIYVFFYFDF